MGVIQVLLVLCFSFAACTDAANNTQLTLLTEYDCGCPGQNVSYTCTVVGGLLTVWRGSAFSCIGSRNEISLRHNDFQTATGVCNNGAIVAYSIENVGSCYTSGLDVRLSTELQGQTITCSIDDGSNPTEIGSATLMVSTSLAPPPSPGMISVTADYQNLVFSWDPVDFNCPSLHYNFSSSPPCGLCTSSTPTTATCTRFDATDTGVECHFNVWSMICGNISGQTLTSLVNLKVPGAPFITTIPSYLDGTSMEFNFLIALSTHFILGKSFMISDRIDGSGDNFTVTYMNTFGNTCGTFTVPLSLCISGRCSHYFNTLNDSSCSSSSSIIVTVHVTNVLGKSPDSNTVLQDGRNNLVDVNFNLKERRIVCTFINQPSAIIKQCSANVTFGENCNQLLNVYEGDGTGDIVSTSQLETVPGVTEYCFVVTANISNITVMVQGNLVNLGSTDDNTVAIVVPLVVILFLLLLIPIVLLTIYNLYKFMNKPLTDYSVIFSVEDKPGSIAAALKVFKDHNVNILGLNTHLHHAAFDRDAGKGCKFNHIHCLCSPEDKRFLELTFADSKFIGMNEEIGQSDNKVPLTAIIKVKDAPGGLWEVLNKIGNHGINLLGVNTRSERESTPGYKDNYVRCSCSEKNIHQLQTGLTAIGAINVKFQLHNETALLTKAISYLVRDQPGALASTLEIFRGLGLNISGVNEEHMGGRCRDREGGLRLNFVECSIDEETKNGLFKILLKDYGAVDVDLDEVPAERLHDDPNYKIVIITIQNEKGSLNRALKAFSDLHINLHGVNILKPSFNRDFTINYKHYHLEITVTSEQERELKDKLYARGLAIDVMPFDLKKYINQNATEQQQNPEVATKSGKYDKSDGAPETKTIEFSVRDEVGALTNALQIFCDLGINITKVNPAHLSQVHKSEYVECSCEPEKRNTLIEKLMSKSYGATKAVLLPKDEVPKNPAADAHLNYCVIKFSVENKSGAIVNALKAFPELGVNIIKVNPPHIKLQNQYVECCCAEEVRTKVVNKLKAITGVTHIHVLTDSEVTKEHEDPNYCVIKFTVGDAAGIIVRALRVFFDNNVNIIGVNTLMPAFERKSMVKFKKNNVVFLATEEQALELKHKLLVTGVALDAEEYKPHEPSHEQHEEYEPEEPSHEEHEHENAIKLTSIKVLPN